MIRIRDMKQRKVFVVLACLLAAGGAGFLLISANSSSKLTYRFDKVSRGDVVVNISATGTLNAVTTVQVGSQVSGTIAKLFADFNDNVTKDQLLAQLDPTFLQATVNEQRANLDRAQAQVHEAERNFTRTSGLFAKSLVSQADMDAATTNLESAKATLKQMQASVDRAEVNLRFATIRAPISGVVISRDVDVGQTVAASLQAPTLFTIANDLRKMQVQASVDEADIGNVKVGQDVTFRVDAYPEQEFVGKVSQVRLKPIITQNVVTYIVIIDVENSEQKLMPGMTATVSVEVSKSEDVIRVPTLAIRFTPPPEALVKEKGEQDEQDSTRATRRSGSGWESRRGGEQEHAKRNRGDRVTIWVMENGVLKPVFARRGIQNTQFVELKRSELKEGDEIIVAALGGQVQSATAQQQNPFGPPRMPGPGGGGGRRGGF